MQIIGQENANYAKTLLYYGPKESIACPFFWFFCQKNVHCLKTLCSHVIFFKFLETPCFHSQERSKIGEFCQNYTLLWSKKWIRFPYFPSFNEKNSALCAYLVRRPFSKKQTTFMFIFNQKNVHSLKKLVLSCHFFIIFHKKPLLSCLYFVEKRLFCENFTI